jgi:hypothetical protein
MALLALLFEGVLGLALIHRSVRAAITATWSSRRARGAARIALRTGSALTRPRDPAPSDEPRALAPARVGHRRQHALDAVDPGHVAGFLAKPITPAAFERAVRRVMRARHPGGGDDEARKATWMKN